MPRKEFIELVKEIQETQIPRKMSKREFIWLFDYYEKRTSGNVWRINGFLNKEKMVVHPSYQSGWIDEMIELKPKDKAKIKSEEKEGKFDPVTRLSILEAALKTPISVKKEDVLKKAYHLMWKHNFSQLPVMNNERKVLGIISWQTIAKGFIAKKKSELVKDFMSKDFKVLDYTTSLFDAIKEVIKSEIVFVTDQENKIKGPITTADLNKEFIEQIEPFILLEEIENFIRLILHDKVVLEDLIKLTHRVEGDNREIESLSDLTFGEYIRIISNNEVWDVLDLPFLKADFVNDLDKIREIRNKVMHFHPDKISINDLDLLRNIAKFLKNFFKNLL